mmetsp:Transcript_75077/g.174098  ORF Transcript_75077/g.174098 Transcript_75077/m.174098 type:complete len:204 (-) Transcript_75077:25-636(-)
MQPPPRAQRSGLVGGVPSIPATTLGASNAGSLAAQGLSAIFQDVHAALRHLAADVEGIRVEISENDEGLRSQIEDISQDLDNEAHDRADSFHRLRTEFEAFAHHKAERVVRELEDFVHEQASSDGVRWRTLVDTSHELDRLKFHLAAVCTAWGQLSNSLADPTRQPKCQRVRHVSVPGTHHLSNGNGSEQGLDGHEFRVQGSG